MNDPTPRRPAPSSLTFPPPMETFPQTQTLSGTTSANVQPGHGTVSMPFIKRHVTRRLQAAKQECDKELTALTNAITTFFEDRLREGVGARELISESTYADDSDRESRRLLRDTSVQPTGSNLQEQDFELDDTSDEEGYEADPESTHHSRQASLSSSPASLRRQSTFPRDLTRPPHKHVPGETSPLKHTNTSEPSIQAPLLPPQPAGAISRRFSRSINIVPRPALSTTSSRSTSRSRSPMPPARALLNESTNSRVPCSNRRSSRILVDDPIDPFMLILHSIIALCTDIIDMPISALTSSPDACAELVQKVQNIGLAWDDHPEWHGRAWYVQLLLTVAGLSRVVEWWEAEKQFWNFDDDDESGTPAESGLLTFVLKPLEGAETSLNPTAHLEHYDGSSHISTPDRRSRDEQRKHLGIVMTDIVSESSVNESPEPPSLPDPYVLDPGRLQEEVERAQSMNIVMELHLDGDTLIWVNDAWRTVVGIEPEEMGNVSISSLLGVSDANIFKEATLKLQQDDSRTVEVEFKLRVEPNSAESLYRRMDGKGMIMFDRIDGNATHSMWVIKPLSDPEPQTPQGEFGVLESEVDVPRRRVITPHINATEILCRICECQIPQWFFEKHSETCHESHKLEADIGECNDSIAELRNTIRELGVAIEKGGITVPEYRGVPILTPVSPPNKTGPLQIFRPPLAGKLQRMGVKKLQKRLLEQLEDILQVAAEITIPSLKEDESEEPIERQRLLSPGSERKISTVRTWNKPTPEDPALAKLVSDVDILMKAKLDSVVRMQNTVRYAEKVRQEWEEKIHAALAEADENQEDEEESEIEKVQGDTSSTTSEYAYAGDDSEGHLSSADPTPMAPSPVIAALSDFKGQSSTLKSSVPKTYLGRASTPSSTSSPLALATPIIPSSPTHEHFQLPQTEEVHTSNQSSQTLIEPKVLITPPLTPSMSSTSLHRRHSSVIHKYSSSAVLPESLSPRLPSAPPSAKTTPSSIKDFEIIKPISKGAFGSVFLAKKKVTGDYYAIKVLKKSDMIAKNQITNVKAERLILMKQGESPFVVKLFWTFQGRDNLYLVMEYLNGGDCAALIKVIGSLPEEWTRNYIAEVILGLEYLHQRGVTHRDLKPDNLLIDQKGHLKLTDFGLSRIGLLGRQARDPKGITNTRPNSRPPSLDSVYLSSPLFTPDAQLSSYFGLRTHSTPQLVAPLPSFSAASGDDIESSGSEGVSLLKRVPKISESPLQSFASELATDLRSHVTSGSGSSTQEQKVVGTPDYLAPETILGLSKDDRMVDWWALGVITYEFLHGFPPFHADTPDKVFENILSGRIDWHEEYTDFSEQAKDFMARLLQGDPSKRLGAGGSDEVKAHPFLAGIGWDKVTSQEAQFIPQVTDPESTDYFDSRGAILQLFQDEDGVPPASLPSNSTTGPMSAPVQQVNRESVNSPSSDDFGAFSFKNLGVLKQANDDVIRKLKTEQMPPLTHTVSDPNASRRRSLSQRIRKPPSVLTATEPRHAPIPPTNPPSPSTSASSVASSPSFSSVGPSTPGSYGSHNRRPSEFGAVERFKINHLEGERRGTMPSRLRTASISSADPGSSSDQWPSPLTRPTHFNGQLDLSTNPSTRRRSSAASSGDRMVTILIAEDNPISAKILETLLTRMGCRCIVVSDGSEAVSVANGDICFDVIMLDLNMPIIDGEAAAQYIKSTNSKNTHTPIISVSAYTGVDANVPSHLFVASLSKPVQKADILSIMRNLGFRTATSTGSSKISNKIVIP